MVKGFGRLSDRTIVTVEDGGRVLISSTPLLLEEDEIRSEVMTNAAEMVTACRSSEQRLNEQ